MANQDTQAVTRADLTAAVQSLADQIRAVAQELKASQDRAIGELKAEMKVSQDRAVETIAAEIAATRQQLSLRTDTLERRQEINTNVLVSVDQRTAILVRAYDRLERDNGAILATQA